jgi:hypothetical protein
MLYRQNRRGSFLVIVILGLFFIINLCDGQCCYGSDLCIKNNATLNCLRDNFDNLYSTNYALFWSILKVAERKAISCKSTADTAAFLKLASIKSTNAEFNEYLSETIENLAIKKSKCFLDSLSTLDWDAMANIISLLKNPMFVEKQVIMKVFSKERNKKKYKRIMNIYLQ